MKRAFNVYYRKDPSFRLDKTLTIANVVKEVTHAHVKSIYAEDIEEVFYQMQGEVWSPNGEARELISSKGLHHTSMSVGDVVVDIQGGVYWQANLSGWKEILK